MRNDRRKMLMVIVLDEPGVERETRDVGTIGFRVKGRQLMLLWADEGKTWERVKEIQ